MKHAGIVLTLVGVTMADSANLLVPAIITGVAAVLMLLGIKLEK